MYSWKLIRKLKWQIPGEPLAARYNCCQGPVPGRGPAARKHWSTAEVKESVELYFPFPPYVFMRSSWLKHREKRLGYDKVIFWQVGTNCLRIRVVIYSNPLELRTAGIFSSVWNRARCETDNDVFKSGVVGGKTTSQIIALIIRNVNLNQTNSVYLCV